MNSYIPGLSLDCVIFGFHDNRLKILLLKLKNIELWALPGGFIRTDKDLDAEANEVLKTRTGISEPIFLRQFHSFGEMARNDPDHAQKMVDAGIIPPDAKPWFDHRFISFGYYALVEYSKVEAPQADMTSEYCEWCDLNTLPSLMLDHAKMVKKAHQTLKRELDYQPIGINLLPEYFTMSELQSLYETILGKSLDRRNFRRKILGYNILKATTMKRKGVAHKAPILYQFHNENYQKAIETGFHSNW